MEQPPIDPWLGTLQVGVFLASLIFWVQLIGLWLRRGALLEYEPRKPVPWGPIAIVPAVALVLLALLSALMADAAHDVPIDPSVAAQNLLASMFLQAMLTALVLGIAVLSNATAFDLGLRPSGRNMARDIIIGLAACLAAVAPVHAVQGLMLYLLEQEDPSHHPLVKMITRGEPHFGMLLLATLAAVVVAPICEEVIYRLMLQGWLEKWEDERLGWRAASIASANEGNSAYEFSEELNDEVRMTNDESPELSPPSISAAPPRRGVAGLPHGWFPILVGSALFAAAHFGYGPEPVPIFLLALILGYVYQRTHCIVPCIVAHALFNLLTMIALWRMVFHAAE